MKLTYLTFCEDCQITEENHQHRPEIVNKLRAQMFAKRFKDKQAWRKYPKFIKHLDK